MTVIIDAALVRILDELINAILEAKRKTDMYDEVLGRMKSTLDFIISTVNEIAMLNKELDAGKPDAAEKLIEHIKKGQEIVRKCSQSGGCCSCFKKPRYAEELVALENSIQTFCQVVMQVQQTRDQKQILKDVRKIHRDINQLNPAERDGTVLSCSVPAAPKIVVDLDGPVDYLKNELLMDGVPIIVISAPEGYGKTVLAQKFCRDEKVEEKFKENIFFVNVSKKPTLKVIVQRLLQHKLNSQVPEFRSDEEAAHHLEQFLKEKMESSPILLVLDDVRPESASLLDNLKFQIPNYKVLVTSTSVFPSFGSTYKLKPLNDEDSMTLFRHSAFPDGDAYTQDELLVNQIVKACKGVPLALTVVGKSLCGQPAAIWQHRAAEISKGGPIFESNTHLQNCLKRSLEVLDNRGIIKECYMDLGSFPEGQWIPATALIDLWAELYGLDEDGMDSVAKLHELDNLNLVNLEVRRKDTSESDDGYYNSHFVMQHDILRQLVNQQSNLDPVDQRKRLIVDVSGNKFPKWWREQKLQSVSARLLSITTDETFSPNWSNLQATEVEALVLNCNTNNYKLPEFMDKMNKLRVLIVINYGFLPAELTNFYLLRSLSNLKKVRLEKVSVPSLDLTSVQLEHLQKISLVNCRIGQAFSNASLQVTSSLPSLMEISIDSCADLRGLPVWFCDLVQLKKLCISNCSELSELPEEIGKLENLEVLRLCSCVGLVKLPATIRNLSKLRILDISHCARIVELPIVQIGELHNLAKLLMNGCSNISKVPPSAQNLNSLKDVICDKEAASLWEPVKQFNKSLNIKVRG